MSFAKLIYFLIFNTIQHNAFDPYWVILNVILSYLTNYALIKSKYHTVLYLNV